MRPLAARLPAPGAGEGAGGGVRGNNLGQSGQKKPPVLRMNFFNAVQEQQRVGIPRSDKMIGIDATNKTRCICVPLGDDVRVALPRSFNGRVAASVIGQLPGKDSGLINIARNDKLYIFEELLPDVHVGVKFVMCLLYTKFSNVSIHTT
jgi:hypothetical protein